MHVAAGAVLLVHGVSQSLSVWSQLNSTQRASMDAGVKTPQCPHLSVHFCISSTTINL